MPIKVKLYGDLRKKISQVRSPNGVPSTLNVEIDDIKIVLDVLSKLHINQKEISHIFVNNIYSRLEQEVKNGDRIGIFPKKMGLLFVEIRDPL